MAPGSRYRIILSVCDDNALRWSRELLLKAVGYEVHSFSSNERPGASLVRRADLAIVCDSIPWRRAVGICDELKLYNPSIRCLDLARETYFGERAKVLGGADFRKMVDDYIGGPVQSESLPVQ